MDNAYDGVMAAIGAEVAVNENTDFLRLGPNELTALEAVIGYPLPTDYRHFLEKYGCCMGEGYTIFTDENGGDGSSVDVFYGVRPGNTYDLLDRRDAFSKAFGDELPTHYLAIASGSGEEFIMSLAGENRGRVYWWDLHAPPGEPNSAADPEYIAASFDAFVRSLRVRDY